ncbi:MAG: sensor histidine kinase [Hyphomicrobiaceae bacterium]
MNIHTNDLRLESAVELLTRAGYFGLLRADENLIAEARSGQLVEDIPLGRSICETIPALFGFEDRIQALRRSDQPALELPNITEITPSGPSPRLDYVVQWDDVEKGFLVFVAHPIAINELSVELQRQTRRRMMAEAELVEQADAIAQANEALRRANEDLYAFARIISHDLKAPMRALRYFADDLEAAMGGEAFDQIDAKEHLERLRTQSRRMSGMITGLLRYSEMEQADDAKTSKAPRAIIDSIVASLHHPPSFSIEITGDWPKRVAHPELFDLVLRNIIDNAIKHHDRDEGQVTVSALADGQTVTVNVIDDGPGIAEEFHAAVFESFARFGPDGKQGGHGLGLAFARRACQRTSGELQLISAPSKQRGTRFEISWPLTKANEHD